MTTPTHVEMYKWPSYIAIITLALELISPNINYLIIRIVIASLALYYLFQYSELAARGVRNYTAFLYLVIVIVFNPIFIIGFDRIVWILIDLLVAAVFIRYNDSDHTF